MSVAAVAGAERIGDAFARAKQEGRLAIVVYLTVGYPEREATPELARAALDAGADVLELGVPFSDPLADGATVQRASQLALSNGTTLATCLAVARDVAPRAPVVLMGYANPFLRYGLARFAADAAEAGVAGVIMPDVPAEEASVFDDALAPHGLVRIDMYAPTTPDERLARLVPRSRGFAYCVSLTGVTGARAALGADVAAFVARVRAHALSSLAIAVGFGISRPEHVAALRTVADGVAIGSAVLDAVANAPAHGRAGALARFVGEMRTAGER